MMNLIQLNQKSLKNKRAGNISTPYFSNRSDIFDALDHSANKALVPMNALMGGAAASATAGGKSGSSKKDGGGGGDKDGDAVLPRSASMMVSAPW